MTAQSTRILLLLVLMGFALMFIDVRYMHRHILSEYWQAWIPLVMSIAGMIVTTLLLLKVKARIAAAAVYAIGLFSGLLGSYLHTEGDLRKFMRLVAPHEITTTASNGGEHEEEHTEVNGPPLLAPIGFSGLCAFGLIAAASARNSSRDNSGK